MYSQFMMHGQKNIKLNIKLFQHIVLKDMKKKVRIVAHVFCSGGGDCPAQYRQTLLLLVDDTRLIYLTRYQWWIV